MANIIWTEPALQTLDNIAEYIALDNPKAARDLVQRVFEKVTRLEDFPRSGRIPPELPKSIYCEILVKPCRIIYRIEDETVFMLHVVRDERDLRLYMLENDH